MGKVGDWWGEAISRNPENKDPADFYPTPPEGTRALLHNEQFFGLTWEPACGDGAISKELVDAGCEVLSTDIAYRGYGEGNVNFLLEWDRRVDNVVTNPPFNQAEEFAQHGLKVAQKKVALLCRLAWLEGTTRRDTLFTKTPLARVWVFSRRLQFDLAAGGKKGTGGMIAFAWYVWDHSHVGPPTIGWLR